MHDPLEHGAARALSVCLPSRPAVGPVTPQVSMFPFLAGLFLNTCKLVRLDAMIPQPTSYWLDFAPCTRPSPDRLVFDPTFRGVVAFPQWVRRVDGIDALDSRDFALPLLTAVSFRWLFLFSIRTNLSRPPGWHGNHLRERFLERAVRRRPGQENSCERPPASLSPGVHAVVEGSVRRGEVPASGPVGFFGRRRPLLSRILNVVK